MPVRVSRSDSLSEPIARPAPTRRWNVSWRRQTPLGKEAHSALCDAIAALGSWRPSRAGPGMSGECRPARAEGYPGRHAQSGGRRLGRADQIDQQGQPAVNTTRE